MTTPQIEKWKGQFGQDYTKRNMLSVGQMNDLYVKQYGTSRTEMNYLFLDNLPRTIRILEVGAGTGTQLELLQRIDFDELYGIDSQLFAVEQAKHYPGLNVIVGSALDIPFKDNCFDLVFTSGLLIHIAPNDIEAVMAEIVRCSNQYVWCFEYYSDTYTEVKYRGESELLWKANFAQMFQDKFDLILLKEQHFKRDDGNIDTMFLLEKVRVI